MKTDVKKETSTAPTKAQVEIPQRRKRKKSFSPKLYHIFNDLSSLIS